MKRGTRNNNVCIGYLLKKLKNKNDGKSSTKVILEYTSQMLFILGGQTRQVNILPAHHDMMESSQQF